MPLHLPPPALLDGAAKLTSSREAAAAAEAEAKRQEGELAGLQASIAAEAERYGCAASCTPPPLPCLSQTTASSTPACCWRPRPLCRASCQPGPHAAVPPGPRRCSLALPNGHHYPAEDEDDAWERLAAEIQQSEQAAEARGGSRAGHADGGAAPPGGRPDSSAQDRALQAAMQEVAMEGGRGWGVVAGQDGLVQRGRRGDVRTAAPAVFEAPPEPAARCRRPAAACRGCCRRRLDRGGPRGACRWRPLCRHEAGSAWLGLRPLQTAATTATGGRCRQPPGPLKPTHRIPFSLPAPLAFCMPSPTRCTALQLPLTSAHFLAPRGLHQRLSCQRA